MKKYDEVDKHKMIKTKLMQGDCLDKGFVALNSCIEQALQNNQIKFER